MNPHIIVRILSKTDTGSVEEGTGFLVSLDGYIITCNHVIENGVNLDVYLRSSNDSFKGEVIVPGDKEIDYALIKIELPNNLDILIPKLNLSYEIGDRIFSVGYQYANDEIDDFPACGNIIGSAAINNSQFEYLLLSDCYNVDGGLSGAPAWNKETDKIIGVFSSYREDINHAFIIPIDIILEHLFKTPDWHKLTFLSKQLENTDSYKFTIPDDAIIISRDRYKGKIKEILYSEHKLSVKYKLCILYGKSGMGKSTLAYDISTDFGSNVLWKMDQNSSLSNREKNLINNNDWLIVYDNVNLTHPLIADREIRKLRNLSTNILIITKTIKEAKEIASLSGYLNCSEDIIVEIDKFNSNEYCEFLRGIKNIGLNLSKNYQLVIGECLHGIPILLQIIRDYIENNYDYNWIYQVSSENELEDLITKIVQKWIDSKLINDNSRYILSTICFYSFFGITLKSLYSLLKIPSKEIVNVIKPFYEIGLISIFKSKRFPDDSVYVPHSILREKSIEIKQLQSETVTEYLSRNLDLSELINNENPLTAFDAWLIGIKEVFSGKYYEDFTLFRNALDNHMSIFDKIRPRNGISKMEFFQICKVFSQRLENIDATNRLQCDQLIAFAYSTNQLPAHLELGDMIWLGAKHDDRWARSTCIWSAAYHWQNLSQERVKERKLKINKWFQDFFYHLPYTERLTHDFDSAAALGNLCILGQVDFAVQNIANSLEFRRAKTYTLLSDLVIIINLYDLSKKNEKYVKILEMYVEQNWRKIIMTAAKEIVKEYISDKYSFNKGKKISEPSTELINFNKEIDLTCTLADASHSKEFVNLVKHMNLKNKWSAYSGSF